jgi:hypothetical protein
MGNVIKLIEALALFGSVVVVGIGVWGFFFANGRSLKRLSLDGLPTLASKVKCRCGHAHPSRAFDCNGVHSQKSKHTKREARRCTKSNKVGFRSNQNLLNPPQNHHPASLYPAPSTPADNP